MQPCPLPPRRTCVFRVMMALLLEPPAGLDLLEEGTRAKRFPDLVVKCLIRATKRVPHLGPLVVHVRAPYP